MKRLSFTVLAGALLGLLCITGLAGCGERPSDPAVAANRASAVGVVRDANGIILHAGGQVGQTDIDVGVGIAFGGKIKAVPSQPMVAATFSEPPPPPRNFTPPAPMFKPPDK